MRSPNSSCWGLLPSSPAGVPPASAETWPSRAVRLVVPYPPGTATDALSRTVADKLGQAWGQPVVVENQPGANGTIATAAVARATPDGYTLVMIAANHVINASLYRNLPYDDLKDFRAIARIGNAAFVLAVNPSLPAKTVGELVALAKQQPGKLFYASPSNGSPGHLAMEMLKTMSGANLVHVPYKGAAQATTDLIGGQVQVGFVVESSAIPHIKSGKLNALGISSATRSPTLPDVPTIAEGGFAELRSRFLDRACRAGRHTRRYRQQDQRGRDEDREHARCTRAHRWSGTAHVSRAGGGVLALYGERTREMGEGGERFGGEARLARWPAPRAPRCRAVAPGAAWSGRGNLVHFLVRVCSTPRRFRNNDGSTCSKWGRTRVRPLSLVRPP